MSAIGLPAHILAVFVPRPPLEYSFSVSKARPCGKVVTGLAELVHKLDTSDLKPPVMQPARKIQRQIEKDGAIVAHKERIRDQAKHFHPKAYSDVTCSPYSTLFVGRLSFDTTERTLKRELEEFGPINAVKLVYDKQGESRGYAFIEFEREKDMLEAYRKCDGRRIDGRKVIVDVERGRTVDGWLPRRLGGGRGPGRTVVRKR